MMDLTEAPMAKLENDASNGRSVLWIMLAGLGIVMTAGAIAGFMAQHNMGGGGALSRSALAVLVACGAIIAGLTYAIWRNARKLKSSLEPATRREKLNRNILIACGLLGVVIVEGLTAIGNFEMTDPSADSFSIFGSNPMPTGIALLLVFVWAVVMPVVAWFWHTRAIDEQEASAYRDGGYYAAYVYLVLAPTWWLLWRGGFVPEPDGVAIFLIFSAIWSAVWFWKKYR